MKPILKYPGAKWKDAAWIVSHLPRWRSYVEPFAGSAAVYLSLPWRPKFAVINDINHEITNLFFVLRSAPEQLATLISLTPWSREEYNRSYLPTDEPVEKARRTLVRHWMAHGQRSLHKRGWRNAGPDGMGGWVSTYHVWANLPERIIACIDPLRHAEIESKPAMEIIARYNRPHVLLYLDPPYPLGTRSGNSRRIYADEMVDADHNALLDAVSEHKGAVALSSYPNTVYHSKLVESHGWAVVTKQSMADKGCARTEALYLNPALVSAMGKPSLF